MSTLKSLVLTVVVAVVVAAGVSYVVAPSVTSSTLGGSINNVQSVIWQFSKGVSLDSSDSNGGGGSVLVTKSGTIGTGQNQGVWTNKTGRTVYVDYADVITTGAASSSFKITALATTTSSIAASMWLTAPTSATAATTTTLIGDAILATSSPAGYIINSDITTGMTNASGTVPVLDGQSLIFYIRQAFGNACTGSVCEQATSTNRGFNLSWYLQAHYRP